MTQEQLNMLFEITITIHENEWFGDNKKRRDREELQEWVARQLAAMRIYTVPCGSSWGILVEKEDYDKYWNKDDVHSKQ